MPLKNYLFLDLPTNSAKSGLYLSVFYTGLTGFTLILDVSKDLFFADFLEVIVSSILDFDVCYERWSWLLWDDF